MQQYKILLSAYDCEPNRGSEAGNGWNWARQLTLKGHEVWCMTTSRGKDEILRAVKSPGLDRLTFVFVDTTPPWWTKFLNYNVGIYLKYLAWQNKAAREAKKLDSEIHFDLIHHVSYGSLQLGSAMWKLGKPLFFGPVGGGQFPPVKFKRFFFQYWKIEQRRKLLSKLLISFNPNTRRTLQKASLVLVNNQETYDLARDLNAKNIKYFMCTGLPPDYYPGTFPSRKDDETIKLLWVGRLQPRKALRMVLEAISKLDPDIPVSMTIIAYGLLEQRVPGWIRELNLESKVHFRGKVPWAEVKEAYLSHDVFIFGSLRDSFPAQLLEAMGCGLPIITLNHQGARIFVPDNASIKVNPVTIEQTIDDLNNAIIYYYRNPDKRIEHGKNGYDYSKKFAWDQKIDQMQMLYQEMLHPLETPASTMDNRIEVTSAVKP